MKPKTENLKSIVFNFIPTSNEY